MQIVFLVLFLQYFIFKLPFNSVSTIYYF